MRDVVLVGPESPLPEASAPHFRLSPWSALLQADPSVRSQTDGDVVSIFYTSGSTGRPKGVVLSHRNMVTGAKSVAAYLENHPDDRLLAALPLSLTPLLAADHGVLFGGERRSSQLHHPARPARVHRPAPDHRADRRTAALRPAPLAELAREAGQSVRYLANTGGRMPLEILKSSRPSSPPFFPDVRADRGLPGHLPRSGEVDRRPDSIGKAIPNNEVLILREDGTEAAPDEPGEFVQRERSSRSGTGIIPRRRPSASGPWPPPPFRPGIPCLARARGVLGRHRAQGRRRLSRLSLAARTHNHRLGNWVSPQEVEEIIYQIPGIEECAAFGIPHPVLGHSIIVVVYSRNAKGLEEGRLLAACGRLMPNYMVPAKFRS